ncbi:MAG: ABC transporter transmembrane domain-containing protein, partial [Candidatus Kariarchaeaceae archaeon]
MRENMSTENTGTKKFTDRELFGILLKYVRNHRTLFILVVSFLILNTALAIATPLIYHYILNTIESGVSSSSLPESLKLAGIAYLLISISSWFAGAIQFTFITMLNTRVIRDLRIDAYRSVLNNEVLFFDSQKSGDI